MNQIFICALAFIFIIHSAIIDNCIQYSDTARIVCQSCRDGYFVKLGTCVQCSTSTLTECSALKPTLNSSVVSARAVTQSGTQSLLSGLKVQSSNLQNCKQIDHDGNCIDCFGNYKLNQNHQCVKDDPISDTMFVNCLVFSEVEHKCLLCEDGFIEDGLGGCQEGTPPDPIPNQIPAVAVQSDPLLAQTDKTPTLNILLDSKPKNASVNSSTEVKNLNDSIKLFPPSESLSHIQPPPKNLTQSALDPLKVQESNCAELKDNKTCTKCKQGYMLNLLKNTCVTLNKPLELSKVRVIEIIPENVTKHENASKEINTSSNVPIPTVNSTLSTSLNSTNGSASGPKTNLTGLNVTNGSLEIKSNITNSSLTNSSASVNNSVNLTSNISNVISKNTTTLNGTNGTVPVVNSTVNGTNSTAIGSMGTVTPLPTPIPVPANNFTLSNGTIIKPNTTAAPVNLTGPILPSSLPFGLLTPTLPTPPTPPSPPTPPTLPVAPTPPSSPTAPFPPASASLPIPPTPTSSSNPPLLVTSTKPPLTEQKYNVTKTVDPKTGLTVTVIGTTTKPPTKLPFCLKYRDITYECVQCETNYRLYTGKCYDSWEYQQAIKNSKIVYNQPTGG